VLAFSATAAQISPWFELRAPVERSEAETWLILLARALAKSALLEDEKLCDLYLQRPCSTQLTGITIRLPAPTKIEMLTIRFCLAPINWSPSTSRIRSAEEFSNASSGTLPAPETSVTRAKSFSSASSSST